MKITVKRTAPFLHPDIKEGDVLTLLWERHDAYGNTLYIFDSPFGNQYLEDYELDRITIELGERGDS